MRVWRTDTTLGRRRDVGLLLGATAIGMVVTATNGVTVLVAAGALPAPRMAAAWLTWWIGDAMGVLLAVVPLLTWRRGAWSASTRTWGDAILLVGLFATAAVLFGQPLPAGGGEMAPLLFVPFILLALVALRLGMFTASVLVLVLALIAAAATATGQGPFIAAQLRGGLLALWGYVSALAIGTLLVCALSDELAASRQRLLELFAHGHDGIVLIDGAGLVVECNAAAARALGTTATALRSTPWWRWEDGASHAQHLLTPVLATPVHEAVDTGLGRRRLRRADGSVFDAEVQAAGYALAGGSRQAHVVFRDITERLRADEASRKADAAERANRAKNEFLSRMSHELRTPLNAVIGFAQLLELQSTTLPEAQRDHVRHIVRAGQHLLHLVNEVLDLSRIEAGAISIQLRQVDLARAVADALRVVQSAGERAGVHLAGPAADAALGWAWADPTRLHEVLVNLLDNAVKYTPAGGRVWVRPGPASGVPAEVTIEVHDTGRGLTPTQLDNLFEPFNRLGADQAGIEGTGIGLVISRRLAELMHGRLTVSSRAGEGSVFSITLPAAPAAPATAAPAPQAAPAPTKAAAMSPPARSYRVLYIEDNEVNAMLVQAMLALRPDITLQLAATGAQGFERARREAPDLLLIDLQLPDTNGLQLLQRIKAEPALARIPCIAMSADAMPDSIEAAKEAGFEHYLTKPVALEAFLHCVDRCLGEQEPTA